MPRRTIDKEFRKAVWLQGFSLEHDVFKLLADSGWSVLPNRYFFDSYSGRTREYDLLTYKVFDYKGYTFFLVLVIECKFNPGRIVFYVRPLREDDYPMQYFIGDDIAKIVPYEQATAIFKSLKQYKTVFLSNEQVFGYQFFERAKAQDGQSKNKKKLGAKFIHRGKPDITEKLVFSALSAVVQATKYEQEIRNKEKTKKEMILFFPLIVFSGRLYRAFISGKKKSLVKKSVFRYRTGLALTRSAAPEEFCVHIFDLVSVPRAIRLFNQLFKKFSAVVKNSIGRTGV